MMEAFVLQCDVGLRCGINLRHWELFDLFDVFDLQPLCVVG